MDVCRHSYEALTQKRIDDIVAHSSGPKRTGTAFPLQPHHTRTKSPVPVSRSRSRKLLDSISFEIVQDDDEEDVD
eukprot:12008966-Prorocentrum_lima.AAC.1